MDDSEYLDAFGAVNISAGMDGWQAEIPGGYRPLVAAAISLGMPLVGLLFLIGAWMSSPIGAVLVLPILLIILLGAARHGLRSMQSTHLSVRHGDLLLQRRLLGLDRGEPIRIRLSKTPPVAIVGVKGIKTMAIGQTTVPVHAAAEDLDHLTALLNESRQLAATDQERAPIPEALRVLLATQHPS
ncbi:MAG: hypothetical protein ACI8RZ_001941 [Myxococcota bacterium]|jgi:hypothetical protein